MPTHLASLDSLVHPHQMEVQEFSSYALVIDARSAGAYQEDHLPGAVNVPVAADRLAGVQFTSMDRGIAAVAGKAAPPMPYPLAVQVERLSPGDAVLVYCDRGGLDSLVWAGPLRVAGFRVDVLGGGWINYRRWVSAGLELLPRALTFRPLLAPPAGGLCRVVDRLVQQDEQVIDLTALAGQRLVPGLTLQGDTPPAQAAFETALLDALRRLDPQRPVWMRMGIAGHGGLTLPPALRDALYRSISTWLEVPVSARAIAWSDRLQAMGTGINTLLEAISASAMSPAAASMEQWHSLTNAGKVTDALTEIIATYIDPRTEVSGWTGQLRVVRLASLTTEAVATEVDDWQRHR
jgi:tRNA 2-selenouridine synthase